MFSLQDSIPADHEILKTQALLAGPGFTDLLSQNAPHIVNVNKYF